MQSLWDNIIKVSHVHYIFNWISQGGAGTPRWNASCLLSEKKAFVVWFGWLFFFHFKQQKENSCFNLFILFYFFPEGIIFLIYTCCLLNSFHYQETLKVCPPYLVEWQKLVYEIPSSLKHRSSCQRKASSMLAESNVSEMRKLVMGNCALSSRYLCIQKKVRMSMYSKKNWPSMSTNTGKCVQFFSKGKRTPVASTLMHL